MHRRLDFNRKWLYTSLCRVVNPFGTYEEGEPLEGIRLEMSTREVNGYKVLDMTGEIDVYTAPQFKESVNQIISTGQNDLIVNMESVTYMDSSGFGTLLSATKRLKPNGGTVNLVACNSAIDRMLRITRLNTVFGTFQTVDEVIEAINAAKSKD